MSYPATDLPPSLSQSCDSIDDPALKIYVSKQEREAKASLVKFKGYKTD